MNKNEFENTDNVEDIKKAWAAAAFAKMNIFRNCDTLRIKMYSTKN